MKNLLFLSVLFVFISLFVQAQECRLARNIDFLYGISMEITTPTSDFVAPEIGITNSINPFGSFVSFKTGAKAHFPNTKVWENEDAFEFIPVSISTDLMIATSPSRGKYTKTANGFGAANRGWKENPVHLEIGAGIKYIDNAFLPRVTAAIGSHTTSIFSRYYFNSTETPQSQIEIGILLGGFLF